MINGVTALLIGGALVVAWIVGIEVVPDLLRTFASWLQELIDG